MPLITDLPTAGAAENGELYVLEQAAGTRKLTLVALQARIGSGGGAVGGDLAGTLPNPTVIHVTAASKTITHNVNGSVNAVTDTHGTRTFSYDVNGRVSAIAGTGKYQSMTFAYTGDSLTSITVT